MAPTILDPATRQQVESVLAQLDAAVREADYESVHDILERIESRLRPWEENERARDADPLVKDIEELLIETELQILRKSQVDAFTRRLRQEFDLSPPPRTVS